MAMSASSGLVDTGALSAALQNKTTGEELSGALESVLMPAVGATAAGEYAAKLVDAAFDSSKTLADLELAHMNELGIPLGHRKLLMRAIFAGVIPSAYGMTPQVAMTPQGPVQAQSAGAAAESSSRAAAFKLEWPEADATTGRMKAADLHSFGLAMRGHLRDGGRHTLAVDFWGQVEQAGKEIRLTYVHAD